MMNNPKCLKCLHSTVFFYLKTDFSALYHKTNKISTVRDFYNYTGMKKTSK